MAHARAVIKGARDEVSRLGTKTSGISTLLPQYCVTVWYDGEPLPLRLYYSADDPIHALEQYLDDPAPVEGITKVGVALAD